MFNSRVRNFPNFGFRFKFLLYIISLIFCVSLCFIIYFMFQTSSSLIEKQEERGLSLVKSLSYSSELGVLAGDESFLRGAVEGIYEEDDVKYVIVYDLSGKIIKESRKMEMETALPENIRVDVEEKRKPYKSGLAASDGRVIYDFYAPVIQRSSSVDATQDEAEELSIFAEEPSDVSKGDKLSGDVIGFVRVGMSLEHIEAQKSKMMLSSSLIIATIFAVGILISLVLAKRITQPLHKLIEGTKHIGGGELDYQIYVKSSDEIGQLADDFNLMAKNLKENINQKDAYAEELKELSRDLENKVKERTRELQEANIMLQRQSEKIEEANRLKSQFLANMSHELRTPMNAIIGFTNLVIRRTEGIIPERQRQNLEKVRISADNLLALINSILDLSKIEAGKVDVNVESFDLGTLVESCFSTVEPLKGEKVRLTQQIAADVPQLWTDQAKLKQIIINLLSNALKFTEEGEIAISAERENGHLKLAVSDTGIGIEKSALPYIFDEFRQADGSSTRRYGGTGLGLAITKKLVDLLGGRISVESEIAKGSTFTITMPIMSDRVLEDKEKAKDEILKGEAALDRSKKVILAIDDEPNVILLLKEDLVEEGYQIVGAFSGEEGIKKAKEIKPFAITLDIIMPGKDGWETLNELKADPDTKDIPVIIVSILENRDLGYSLGVDDYLVKPIKKEALLATLNRLSIPETDKILVVDDDPNVISLITQILEGENYYISGASNGEEALSAISERIPDLIILDLLMPVMDGFEMIDRLRGNPDWRNIPVVVITAKDLTDADKEFLERGVIKIIQKAGLDKDKLLSELRDTLRLCRRDYKPQT